MTNSAQIVLSMIDDIDATPFGRVGKLLDRMAEEAQRSVTERESLIASFDAVMSLIATDSRYDESEVMMTARHLLRAAEPHSVAESRVHPQ